MSLVSIQLALQHRNPSANMNATEEEQSSLNPAASLRTSGATLAWRGLTIEVPLSKKARNSSDIEAPHKSTKRILDNVSGFVEPGQILFVMGPSGSGKSSLLDTLADRVKLPVQGIQVLDAKLKTSSALKNAAKYVQQTDDLLGVLTVKETFETAAGLYVPDSDKRAIAVNDVIDVLGLAAHQDTKIGNAFVRGLSGGQIRRVSIGCELVSRPRLMFLDEPLSGLDSATAYKIMGELKRIAKVTGMGMIITVHQPSALVFDMADTLLLISEGNTCYFGGARRAGEHFRSLGFIQPPKTSEIEWMLDLINKDFGDVEKVDKCITKWRTSLAADELEQDLARLNVPEDSKGAKGLEKGGKSISYAVGFLQQVKVLTYRGVLNTIRNPAVLWLRCAMYLMLSLLIGLVWLRLGKSASRIIDLNNVLFYIAAFQTFMSVSVLPAYLEERTVLMRERANGAYSIGAYVLSHTIYELPYVAVLAFLASSVTYWMVGLTPSAARFFIFAANLFTTLFVAESMMLLISAVIPILIIGIAAGAMTFGLFMCVMGAFIPIDRIGWWLRWVHYIAVHYYSYSTFSVNNFRGVTYDAAPDSFPAFPEPVLGDSVYASLGLEERIWVNFLVQIAMVVFYRSAAAVCMHYLVRGKK